MMSLKHEKRPHGQLPMPPAAERPNKLNIWYEIITIEKLFILVELYFGWKLISFIFYHCIQVDAGCIPPMCELLTVVDSQIIQVALNGLENILKAGDLDKTKPNPYAVLIEECYGWYLHCFYSFFFLNLLYHFDFISIFFKTQTFFLVFLMQDWIKSNFCSHTIFAIFTRKHFA